MTAIILMTMFGYGNFSSAAQYEVVKDGLVAWYDAEKNTRDGHDENSLVWEDLAGNNDVEVTKNANSYFTADAFRTKNEEFKFPEEILNTINGEEFTVEAEFGKIEVLGTDFATLINSKGNDNFAFFIRNRITEPIIIPKQMRESASKIAGIIPTRLFKTTAEPVV